MLCNWYDKLYSFIRWNGTLSEYFVVSQGAVLSPFLFNLYVDDLLSEWRGVVSIVMSVTGIFGCIMSFSECCIFATDLV